MEEEDLPGALALLKRMDPAIYAALGSLGRLANLEPMHGAGWVMPAFAWGGPGRFNSTTFSAFYAAEKVETAIAETVYHQARALRDENADPIDIQMRALRADIQASDFVDLTGPGIRSAVLFDGLHGVTGVRGGYARGRPEQDPFHERPAPGIFLHGRVPALADPSV